MFTPQQKAINVVGEAVWSDSYAIDDEDTPVCCGLSFLKISNENLDYLKEIVQISTEEWSAVIDADMINLYLGGL